MLLKKIKSPNTFLIMGSLVVLIAILTWILPAGEYLRVIKNGRSIVDPDSFSFVGSNPQGFGELLMSPIRGFIAAAEIIGFVLIVGGAFSIFQKTEAVDSGILAIAKAHKNSSLVRLLLIPIFMTLFSLAGAIFGMSEEIIPFILVFVPMALMLGYDSITGVAIPFIGAGAGFAGAFLNPFTVGIAQGIAEVPLFSGIEYRLVVWFIITTTAILFVTKYARKIKNNPKLSVTFENDEKKRNNLHFERLDNFNGIDKQHKLVLVAFLIGLLVLVFGVLKYQWFVQEICAVFLLTGIVVGVLGKLSVQEVTDAFVNGAKDLIGTALVIALARAILIVATDGKIIDTILFYLSSSVEDFHPIISSHAMLAVQTLINFFVPSGSGQAALTMPIMAPLGDLVGVSRQTAVLAFQFGDGFTNLFIPTSAVTIGVLTLAEIPWEKWAKWILPLELIFFLLALILLIPPYFIGWH